MAKTQTQFICQSCGAVYRKWQGRCDDCGEWNSITEEVSLGASGRPKGLGGSRGRKVDLVDLGQPADNPPRLQSGLAEFDRATGGGLVPGSALLIGGDPGIGKSTLLLQAMAALSNAGHSCVYISGEEATAQVQMRADRLGLSKAPLALGAATNLRDILTTVDGAKPPAVLVIDSIQTVFVDSLDSALAPWRKCGHVLRN